jgi:hypothetical protein
MKKGSPASASINAPWRDSDARDQPDLDERRQRHPVMTGIAAAERADHDEDRGEPDQRDQDLAGRRDFGIEQPLEADVAPLGPRGRDDALRSRTNCI